MIKPDGVQRALVGEIIQRFERKGFTLKALKMFRPSKQLAEEHYKDLSSKPFFGKLVEYIISGPVIAMVRHKYYPIASVVLNATSILSCMSCSPGIDWQHTTVYMINCQQQV